jgi:hypothetical protein
MIELLPFWNCGKWHKAAIFLVARLPLFLSLSASFRFFLCEFHYHAGPSTLCYWGIDFVRRIGQASITNKYDAVNMGVKDFQAKGSSDVVI